MRRRRVWLGLLALLTLAIVRGDERVAWLQAHAVSLASVDPDVTDFSDLQPLGAAIGNARVVILGEQSHGGGAAFLMKTRMVKYLHEVHGFDVLVFESGLYDCARVWDDATAAGGSPSDAVACLLPVWEESRQLAPLARYLDERDGALTLAGMDIQLTETARAHLPDDLSAYLAALNSSILTGAGGDSFRDQLRDLAARVPSPPDEQTQAAFFEMLAAVASEVDRRGGDTFEAVFWRRVLNGAAAYAEQVWLYEDVPNGYIRRDLLMGENLLWLANKRYAGHKLIVWTAGYHAVRDLPFARDLHGAPLVYASHITVGDVVYQAMGADVYTLNFTSAAGEYYDWQRGDVYPVPAPVPGTFEVLMTAAGFDLAFVDWRGSNPDDLFPLTGYAAWNYAPVQADWGRLMDGVVFIREMTPSERVW